jgi:hypothetical protein
MCTGRMQSQPPRRFAAAERKRPPVLRLGPEVAADRGREAFAAGRGGLGAGGRASSSARMRTCSASLPASVRRCALATSEGRRCSALPAVVAAVALGKHRGAAMGCMRGRGDDWMLAAATVAVVERAGWRCHASG